MPSHKISKDKSVLKGTAPELSSANMQILITKNTLKLHAGTNKAVPIAFFFHPIFPNNLNNLADIYPANTPIKAYNNNMVVNRAPLWAGDKNPKHAKISVTKNITMI